MRVKILTSFPEIFPGPLDISLIGNARQRGIWSLEVINIKDFGITRTRRIDDTTYGGGVGMVMLPEVLANTIEFAKKDMNSPQIFYMSPRGEVHNQEKALEISGYHEIIFICARFEGIDERVIEEYNVSQISIGDYVLPGGDVAAIAVLESAIRLLPGVLSNQDALHEESFNYNANYGKLLEYPQYTRPAVWRERRVPEVLLGGNHEMIRRWRHTKSVEITKKFRPDLIKKDSCIDYSAQYKETEK